MNRVRQDVCHVWAHQTQSDARYGHIFFQGDTIYSYGTHFPIARHVTVKGKHVILFTTRGYSSSTSRHKNEVRVAIPPGVPVFYVNDVTQANRDTLKDYAQQIAYQSAAVAHSKSRMPTELERLQSLVDQANKFCETFGFKTRYTMPANVEEIRALVEQQILKSRDAEKKRERARKLAEEKDRAERRERLALWLQGENVYPPGRVDGYDYLRLSQDGSEVMTTSHAIVPIDHVKRVAKLILRKVTAGQPWHSNGETIRVGHYNLDSIDENGDINVGCHRFARAEIERFAGVIGVK